MKAETLKSLQRRAMLATALIALGIVVVIVAYLTAVESGALPSATQPMVTKAEAVASNLPPAKAVAVAPAPTPVAPAPASASKTAARSETKQPASSPTSAKRNVADATSIAETPNAMIRPPQKPTVTNLAATASTPTRSTPFNVSTNVTAEDEHVARHWLENTNQRPAIRVQYRPADIVRLTTELNRGLLVAGSGTTNRREIFLQSKPGTAPLFSPFTKSVAQRFADYSLALNSSPVFAPLTVSLPAYLPAGEIDLAFVPDRTLATDIFAKVASAFRSLRSELAGSNGVVFEGQLEIAGTQPVFDLLEARVGTNRHVFTSAKTVEVR